ncbi:MAG TPA: DNA polymerase III subunit beta [Patescibacteria group bacterium]|nr:DNA polymerase III subunit beta [Patescibacteria group bacterium]
MKISLLAETLQKKISFLNHAISSRSDLPILLNILIETDETGIRLSSTDLEIGIQSHIAAEVSEAGSTTIPAKTFTELIASLSGEKVTLTTQDGSLVVESKKTKSSFQTIPANEFPKLFEEKGELLARVNIEEIKKDLSTVVFAASMDTARPALSGILLKKEESGFLLVGTDGYRLSLKHHPTTSTSAIGSETGLVIPARVLREVVSLKEEGQELIIYIAKGSNQAIFEQGETLLIGRLIEAEFPNYERIIPSDHNSVIFFDREELLKAVKICSIFAREAANIIQLSLKKDKLVVSSQTPSLGENTVEVEAKLTGEENEIAFNARYLLDVLNNLTNTELSFEMTGPLNPGVFKIKDDASYLHLIMPIRVQQ